MAASNRYKWARRAVWGTFLVVFGFGCNPLQTIAFIFHRDEKVPAAYPMAAKDDPDTGEKKKEVTAAVFCHFAGPVPPEFVAADRELASLMAKKCPEIVKAAEPKVKLVIVDPAEVESFQRANLTWKAMHPTQWGKKLNADYVMEVTLAGVQVYQPRSSNQIYEGRADVTVDVYDVGKGKAAPLHNYVHAFTFPKGMVRSVDAIPNVSQFKQMYLDALAVELLYKHVEHKQSVGIAEDK